MGNNNMSCFGGQGGESFGIEASRIEAIGHGVGDIFSVPAWNRVGICTIELK